LLYKGHKIVPYCPRCGTALSSHEVAQGYKDVKEKSVYVKFKIKGRDNAYFLVWTTTPWTLPSNVALCMNAGFDYVEIKIGDEIYVLAEALVPSLFEDYEVVSKKKGKDYEYVEYEPMFPYALGTFRQKSVLRHQRRLRYLDRRHGNSSYRPCVRRGRRERGKKVRFALRFSW